MVRFIVETTDPGPTMWDRKYAVRDTVTGELRTDWMRPYWLAKREAQALNRSPEGTGRQRPPIATYSRAEAMRLGYVEVQDVTSLPAGVRPEVGDLAVVSARGDLRLGLISKIGRTTIYVDVATPTSPDLVTQGRIGGRWRERGYLMPKDGVR